MAIRLVAENLTLERSGRRVIESLSLTVCAGEAMLLTGPNGAGKTTLLRALAGFLPAAAGTIRLEGGDPEREIAAQCHVVGHRDGVKAGMTVAENAAFWAAFMEPVAMPGVAEALARIDLDRLAEVPAAYLSAGQRRRLGLARLLLAYRPVWLLDEPTVSLDDTAVATLAVLVAEHVNRGGLVIAATHVPLGLETARELRLMPRGAVR